MRIELKDGARPTAITAARAILFDYRDQAKRQLDKLIEAGIIVEVTEPIPWCHPTVFVPKKSAHGSDAGNADRHPCLCGSYPVQRSCPSRCSPEPVTRRCRDEHPAWKPLFLTKRPENNHFQILIAEEHQAYTTFITPWGRLKHVRAPMGLSSSNDEYNRRIDAVLSGIPCTSHVVDDILAHD